MKQSVDEVLGINVPSTKHNSSEFGNKEEVKPNKQAINQPIATEEHKFTPIKPSKTLLLIYIIWCLFHLSLLVWSFISNDADWGSRAENFLWPIDSQWEYGKSIDWHYDPTEFISYCIVPLLGYWIYKRIVRKYYQN